MRTPRGFSLLESLVSLFLLILAVLFLLNLLPGSLVATRSVECEVTANSLAESALEDARAAGFSQLNLGLRSLPDSVSQGITYHGTLRVFLPTGADARYVRGLRVEYWWEFSGRRRQLVRQVVVSSVKS